jgi:hypothetical protein
MSPVNEPLLELFRAHGVEAKVQNEWIAFPGCAMKACAAVVQEMSQQACMIVGLDVRLEFAPGSIIVESFTGLGENREEAVANAFDNFATNSLHVFLAAFFRPDDEQVTREEWAVGGQPSQAILGNIGGRGTPPVEGKALAACYEHFTRKIQEATLTPGTHWIRLYYAQTERKTIVCEVFLDNLVWAEMQSEMAHIGWPAEEAFYSVRIFLILRVQNAGPVTPESAVAQLAEIVAPRLEYSEGEVYAALADAGVPDTLAGRAYKFTQIAWGRTFLDGLGITFSTEYVCFNATGEVVESGRLADEPCFAAASLLAKRYAHTPGFVRLAVMSEEVVAVNQALNAGSKPENLVLTPAFLFLEAPTPEGMENARRVVARYTAALSGRGGSATQHPAPAKKKLS